MSLLGCPPFRKVNNVDGDVWTPVLLGPEGSGVYRVTPYKKTPPSPPFVTGFNLADKEVLKTDDVIELPKCLDAMPCAAGTKCIMAVGGVPALAKYIHRCPGMNQDFRSCNSHIHAVCGVDIPENVKKSEMHGRWCFTCYGKSSQDQKHTPVTISLHPSVSGPNPSTLVNNNTCPNGLQTISETPKDDPLPLLQLPPVSIIKKSELIANPYQKIEIPKKSSNAGLKLRTRIPIAMSSKPKMKSVKQYQLFVTVPVPQAQTCPDEHTYRFAIFINAYASMTQDKSVFEFKPELFTKMCDLLYSARGSECEIPIGSMNHYTDMLLSAFSDVHKVRALPGSQDNFHKTCGLKGDYTSYQVGGLFELKVQRQDLVQKELGALVQEFRNIVSSRNFHHAYKLAAYWQYCMEGDTGVVDLMTTFNEQANKIGNKEQVFTRANAKGGVYHLLIADRYGVLSKVLGETAPDVKFDVAFDEILLNQDISRYTEAIVGVYSAAYERVLFSLKALNRDTSFLQHHSISNN